jgi:superkiller protein 3
MESLQKAVDLEPDSLEFNLNLGNALYNGKKFKEAAVVFEAVTKTYPKSVHAWSGLARSLNAARRYEEATAAYEKAIEFAPEDADLHLIVGVIYQENLRKYPEALEHFNKYLRLGGADPVVEIWVKECEKKVR